MRASAHGRSDKTACGKNAVVGGLKLTKRPSARPGSSDRTGSGSKHWRQGEWRQLLAAGYARRQISEKAFIVGIVITNHADNEWLAEWRDDVSTFLPREIIDTAVDIGVTVRPPTPGVRYEAFADPSGGVGDSFARAVSHAEGDTVLLDCVIEIQAPFNPTTATATVAETLKAYGCTEVTGDRYAASWVVEAFAKQCVTYKHSGRDRSSIYADALPLFTAGRARLLDNKKLVSQFANLERRTSSSGRDRIDHPSGGHDDLCNAACGSLGLATGSSEPGWIAYAREMVARAYFEGVN